MLIDFGASSELGSAAEWVGAVGSVLSGGTALVLALRERRRANEADARADAAEAREAAAEAKAEAAKERQREELIGSLQLIVERGLAACDALLAEREDVLVGERNKHAHPWFDAMGRLMAKVIALKSLCEERPRTAMVYAELIKATGVALPFLNISTAKEQIAEVERRRAEFRHISTLLDFIDPPDE
jgi:hypothetical protein